MSIPVEAANWTDVAQAGAAIVGLVVALGLGLVQFSVSWLQDRRRTDAYLGGAVAAAEMAEVSMERADGALGRMQERSRSDVEMSPVLHELEATEQALASFPLEQAPSRATVYGLMGALRAVRVVRGHLSAFLANPINSRLQVDLSEQLRNVVDAGILLRAEYRHLVPKTISDRVEDAFQSWRSRREMIRTGRTIAGGRQPHERGDDLS